MASRPRRLNLLLSVMIALVGVASAPGIAAACAKTSGAVAPKSCCKSMPAEDCHCCDRVPAASTTPLVDLAAPSFRVVPDPGMPALAAPEHCRCRIEAPSTPAQRSDPRAPEGERPVTGPDHAAFVLAADAPISTPGRFRGTPPGPFEGRSPLYLRTSRLLI